MVLLHTHLSFEPLAGLPCNALDGSPSGTSLRRGYEFARFDPHCPHSAQGIIMFFILQAVLFAAFHILVLTSFAFESTSQRICHADRTHTVASGRPGCMSSRAHRMRLN